MVEVEVGNDYGDKGVTLGFEDGEGKPVHIDYSSHYRADEVFIDHPDGPFWMPLAAFEAFEQYRDNVDVSTGSYVTPRPATKVIEHPDTINVIHEHGDDRVVIERHFDRWDRVYIEISNGNDFTGAYVPHEMIQRAAETTHKED